MTQIATLEDQHGRTVTLMQEQGAFVYALPGGVAKVSLLARNDAKALEVLGMADAPVQKPAPPTEAELIAHFDALVQRYLDDAAQARGYGPQSGEYQPMLATLSVCGYDNDSFPRFAADAALFKQRRSEVWIVCGQILAEVRAGQRSVPTDAELLAEMPAIEWPQ